jgi:hypothetical protein
MSRFEFLFLSSFLSIPLSIFNSYFSIVWWTVGFLSPTVPVAGMVCAMFSGHYASIAQQITCDQSCISGMVCAMFFRPLDADCPLARVGPSCLAGTARAVADYRALAPVL